MPIVREWGLDVFALGVESTVTYLHFDSPRTISAQVAVALISSGTPVFHLGVSAFAQDFGPAQQIGSAESFGSYARWFYKERVTDLWVTARTDDTFLAGSARVFEWE